ncbi:unnamed protein product [Linum tenue]|uniref:Terpene synthase metal-binding domain-containing protein n=1 Tax=Linum tenue TaxID=586396 RepID=A0AAV0RJ35_9ROSI|nr:unnamed protein product [Linum tenue]
MVQTLTRDFRLNLPLDAAQIDAMIRNNRDVALTGVDRSNGRDAYLAYILEGIGSSHQARGNAMRFQRKNGSILNSPSATAAAVIHGHDDALSLGYLRSVLRTTTAGSNAAAGLCIHVTRIYCSCAAFGGQDFQKLAVQDFNSRQSLHRKELQHLMQWLKEKKLDDTTLAKVKTRYCHFHGSTTFTEPELSHARILLCKHAVLVCVVDAVFDIDGTHEEQLNIVDLLQRWDVNGPKAEFCSKRVETIYWAIHGAICETVEKAFPTQGRSVMDHVVELWVEIVKGMLQEAEWCRTSTIPTLEEYMATSSITLGVAAFLLPAIYSAGHKLEDDVVRGPQYQRLFLLTTTIGRLLNDVRGFEREAQEGNVNAVSLRIMRRGMDMEEAVEEVENLITTLTRQMVRLTTGEDNCGEVPKAVRLMFWRAVKGFFFFYMKEDLYHASTKLVKVVESVMNEPITIA